MIFATVGTQLPFPRLIAMLDAIAGRHGLAIVAQAGAAVAAPHLDIRPHLAPAEFEALFAGADRVVAHAGIGTVLTARRLRKPLILVPRRADLGEHRNDHQAATAKALSGRPGLYVAEAEDRLEDLLTARDLAPMSDEPSPTEAALIARLRAAL